MKKTLLFGMGLLLLNFNLPAEAATFYVPTGKPTIQQAIDSASDGDTIMVKDGAYVENLNFIKKAITVKSVNGPTKTFIDGSYSGSVVTFESGEGKDSVLSGFTLTKGAAAYGGGILCDYNSSPTITNCVIDGNDGSDAGGGMYCGFASPVITNCTFSNNSAGYGGAGIYCDASSPTITECTFSGNATYEAGGAMFLSYSRAKISKCTLKDNMAGYGGAIFCETSSPSINNSKIIDNVNVSYGAGAIYFSYCSSPTIAASIISGNASGYYGGAFICEYSSPNFINCTITGNMTGEGGGAIFCSHASPKIKNCTFSANYSGYLGGAIYGEYSSPSVTNSILWGNVASEGHEIFLSDSSVVVSYSDVQNDWEWEGTGNINEDPLFVGNGNYHLKTGSPCIDKAGAAGAPVVDIDGHKRPQDGNKDGIAAYDMGSDEYALLTLAVEATLNKTAFAPGETINLGAHITNGETEKNVNFRYFVTLPTGSKKFFYNAPYTVAANADTNLAISNTKFYALGTYTVTAKFQNPANGALLSQSIKTFTVAK